MPVKISAGLLMYRFQNDILEIFLVHPGGPYFRNKDTGYWTIPKGEVHEEENLLETAKREFQEELGIAVPTDDLVMLEPVKQKGGKIVHAWAFAGNIDVDKPFTSNYFEIEWPPRSGNMQSFPEIDQALFFPADIAKRKINTAQVAFIEQLEQHLGVGKTQTVTQQTLFV